MDFQNIIAGLIVLLALFYVGKTVAQKLKSFSAKSSACASDCGCGDSKKSAKNSFVRIPKS